MIVRDIDAATLQAELVQRLVEVARVVSSDGPVDPRSVTDHLEKVDALLAGCAAMLGDLVEELGELRQREVSRAAA